MTVRPVIISGMHLRSVVLLVVAASISLGGEPGPAAGAVAPNFQALDQTGRKWDLKDLMGPRGLMLVFFRSADW